VGYWATETVGGGVGGYLILTNSQALVFDSFPPQGLRYRCVKDAAASKEDPSKTEGAASEYGNDGNTVVF